MYCLQCPKWLENISAIRGGGSQASYISIKYINNQYYGGAETSSNVWANCATVDDVNHVAKNKYI